MLTLDQHSPDSPWLPINLLWIFIVIMEVDIVHFYELKWNFGRALKNDDVCEEWKDDTAGVLTSFV